MCSWPREQPLCLGSSLFATLRPKSKLAFHPTPPELLRPSGGIIAGVRSTRDFHPRHLPPLIFLRSSTVCSSSNLPVLFHTDTTYGIQRTNDTLSLKPTPHPVECRDLEPTPEQASTEAPTSIATVTQAQNQDPRWRNLSSCHTVDMSLTTRPASKSRGRRAHQHARSAGLTGRTVARIITDMPLTTRPASKSHGRRTHRHSQAPEPATSV